MEFIKRQAIVVLKDRIYFSDVKIKPGLLLFIALYHIEI